MAKGVWIKVFGCQMNYHDSERILSHLQDIGYSKCDSPDQADLILFVTCAVRNLANLKFYSSLGEVKKFKKANPNLIIGVGGCVSQTDGQELLKKYKHLNFIFGTDVLDSICEIVYRAENGENKIAVTEWDASSAYSIQTKITHGSPQAFVNIIKGCNNFCSYCIVPYARGREKSRRIEEIVSDVNDLVTNKGIQEITLLGQNVNSFGKENNETLAQLLRELEKISGIKRIRYTTSHPKDLSDELIKFHGESKKLAKHLQLAVQSGSNHVLQLMNRNHTREHYLGLLKKIREQVPDIAITTDIIVGFPGETEEDYNDTIKLLEEAQFDFIYAYKYSPRQGTKAFDLPETMSEKDKGNKLFELQQLQLEIQRIHRQSLIGKKMELLVEGKNEKDGVMKWHGRSSCNREVFFTADDPNHNYKWQWVEVEITEATALSLQGKLCPVIS